MPSSDVPLIVPGGGLPKYDPRSPRAFQAWQAAYARWFNHGQCPVVADADRCATACDHMRTTVDLEADTVTDSGQCPVQDPSVSATMAATSTSAQTPTPLPSMSDSGSPSADITQSMDSNSGSHSCPAQSSTSPSPTRVSRKLDDCVTACLVDSVMRDSRRGSKGSSGSLDSKDDDFDDGDDTGDAPPVFPMGDLVVRLHVALPASFGNGTDSWNSAFRNSGDTGDDANSRTGQQRTSSGGKAM